MSANIRLNGQDRPLAHETLMGLLSGQNIDPGARGVAVAINGEVVPRRTWATTRIRAGDEIEIVNPFAGG